MRTVTVDIINEKAIKLLEDMELLQLIRLHKQLPNDKEAAARIAGLKGAMAKQSIEEIEKQLKEMRDEWQ